MTEQWTEEKLKERLGSYLADMGHFLTAYELDALMGFIKSATHLKGNTPPPVRFFHPDDKPNIAYNLCGEDMDRRGFKSTEEWKE